MTPRQNIFLVGMMGAGKSAVGRQLAARLRLSFFDSDHEIQARTGVSIPVIFEVEGEAGFRRREEQVLDLLGEGLSNASIGHRLDLTEKTVKNHLASIYQKLDARDRTQAVLQAVRMGIVHLD